MPTIWVVMNQIRGEGKFRHALHYCQVESCTEMETKERDTFLFSSYFFLNFFYYCLLILQSDAFSSAPLPYLNRGIHLGFSKNLASMEIPRNPQGRPHLGQLFNRKIYSQNSVTEEKNGERKHSNRVIEILIFTNIC